MTSTDIIYRDNDLSSCTLDHLFAQAEGFGHVSLYSSTKRTPGRAYKCTIYFATIPGTALKAESEFDLTLSEALAQAITKARAIKAAFRDGCQEAPT